MKNSELKNSELKNLYRKSKNILLKSRLYSRFSISSLVFRSLGRIVLTLGPVAWNLVDRDEFVKGEVEYNKIWVVSELFDVVGVSVLSKSRPLESSLGSTNEMKTKNKNIIFENYRTSSVIL